MVRPQVAVLDDELPDANEAGQEGYKETALQEAAQVLRTDHQVYRQQPDEKQNEFSNRKPPRCGVRRPENRNHGQYTKEREGKLDGQEKDSRPRLQEVNHIEDAGARQKCLRSGNRYLKRQNKESKEDSRPSN